MLKFILKLQGATLLRIGMSLVFLWFGTQQFLQPEAWIGFIPQNIVDMAPVGPVTLVHLNGALEIVFGIAVFFGLFTRVSALILALHMADITYIVGYDAIGVRDFGLSIAAFAIALNGADAFTLDRLLFFGTKEPEEKDEENIIEPGKPQFKYVPGQFHV